MMDPPSSLKQRVLHEVAGRASPTRSQGDTRKAAWLVFGLVFVGAAALMRGVPEASASRPMSYLLVSATVAIGTALLTTGWTLFASASSLGRPRSSLRAIAIAVPITLAFGALMANAVAPETWSLPAHDWLAHGMGCLLFYASVGSVLLLVFLFGLRPLDPVAPGVTGAALGAVVGAWATSAVALQCPVAEPSHVILTHVAPGLLLTLSGAVIGRRVLTVKYRARRA